jgi:GNAT superfamily N-acetyltransferase
MESDYRIRRCLPDDVPALVALQRQWAAEDNIIGMVAATAEEVQQWLDQCCWVAEAQGRIIGFACGTVQTSDGLAIIPAGERYLRLDELYVVPDRRDRGVGGRLVDRVLADAAERGITRGRVLSAARDWRRIIDFYQDHGFRMWYVELYR